jgi:imidazolonepropionase
MLLLKNLHEVLTLCPAAPAIDSRPRVQGGLGELGILHNAALVLGAGRIQAAGNSSEVCRNYEAHCDEVFDGAGVPAVYLPGFVDSHTHPVYAATREDEYEMRCQGRTYQEIAAHGGGIRSSVRKTRAASEEFLLQKAAGLEAVFLAHGTTTVEAKSGYGLTVKDELKMLRVIARLNRGSLLEWVPTFLGAHAVPPEYEGRTAEYTQLVIDEMLPRVTAEGLAEFCDVFCEAGYFPREQAHAILSAASALGLKLKIHAEEFSDQSGASLAAELGAVSADHLECISDTGIDALRASGTVATLLPGTAFNLGLKHYPPARRLIDAGVAVALATDFNPGSSHSPNMAMMLSIACSQMHMSPAEAIAAATINAAWALGRADRIGSLEPNKQGDLIGLAVENYRMLPYYYGVNHCRLTIKRGTMWQNQLLRKIR